MIAGNHDITFDEEMLHTDKNLRRFGLDTDKVESYLTSEGVSSVKDLLTNCVYLEDAWVELFGIKIYGSPW